MKSALVLGLAALAVAQDSGNSTLADLIANNNDTLSTLNTLLVSQPDLLETLSNLSNITVLAPSNDALNELIGDGDITDISPGDITALLTYHVLNGTYYASNITSNITFVPTLLTNSSYANVTGGQVVGAVSNDGNVSFVSALLESSYVTQANLNFTGQNGGGVVHIIDRVLTIPQNLVSTAVEAGLSALVGAVTVADLGPTLLDLENITVFAPNNAAFSEIASATENLTTEALASILQGHVVQGTVAYSSTLSNMTIETVDGNSVNITVTGNGTVYVDNARVVIPNVLIANGVVHVIDGVLNPNATDTSYNNTAPAFSGASSVSDQVPYTSGVATPTGSAGGLNTASQGQTSIETSTSDDPAPMVTAAVAMGALFGGAAVLANF